MTTAGGRLGRGDADAPLLPRMSAWYGKLPSHGDFVGRGFPRRCLQVWDGWLQHVLPAAAQRLGGRALDEHLLGMPVWQALLLPQRGGDGVWSGIVAGSCDRVGRAFPLLLAEVWDARTVGSYPLAALHERAQLLAQVLDEAQQQPPAGFEACLASLATAPLADTHAGGTLDQLRASHAAAASFWWRAAHRLDDWPPPAAEPWPPGDDLLPRLLGLNGTDAASAAFVDD